MTKYRAIAENRSTNQRVLVLPRSKKTALFTSQELAIRALDSFSKRLTQNGWRGLIYAGHDELPCYTIAL